MDQLYDIVGIGLDESIFEKLDKEKIVYSCPKYHGRLCIPSYTEEECQNCKVNPEETSDISDIADFVRSRLTKLQDWYMALSRGILSDKELKKLRGIIKRYESMLESCNSEEKDI